MSITNEDELLSVGQSMYLVKLYIYNEMTFSSCASMFKVVNAINTNKIKYFFIG
jgi:hypothetical protein